MYKSINLYNKQRKTRKNNFIGQKKNFLLLIKNFYK